MNRRTCFTIIISVIWASCAAVAAITGSPAVMETAFGITVILGIAYALTST